MFGLLNKKLTLPTPDEALDGRPDPIPTAQTHAVFGCPLKEPVAEGHEEAIFAMGCFWGVERLFWNVDGVVNTAAGYTGGYTPNPTYQEVCSGKTGHAEAVRVVYDPAKVSYSDLLRMFWEEHDPTQGMRQGNDQGTQYRSAIYYTNGLQQVDAEQSNQTYNALLQEKGLGPTTTELHSAGAFYFAEEEHQQYLHKNPDGYCGLKGTGVACPMPLGLGLA
ncbi:peptide-methionine (S)-S-oxide reductase MsrA [Celeribacter sp.]|uniref:peptide-methionine (S)-S-oxide reductase MsrA n=1 Tax=Celeribacter sp. TaxID=1890673 RepID=UPI003A8FEF52